MTATLTYNLHMGFVRSIEERQDRDWTRWEGYFPKCKRVTVELDGGGFVDINYEEGLKVGSRVGLIYFGCGYRVGEILPF